MQVCVCIDAVMRWRCVYALFDLGGHGRFFDRAMGLMGISPHAVGGSARMKNLMRSHISNVNQDS
jgi:hypothetical protein